MDPVYVVSTIAAVGALGVSLGIALTAYVREAGRIPVEAELQRRASAKSCSSATVSPLLKRFPRSKVIYSTWCQMGIEEQGLSSEEARARTEGFWQRFPRYTYAAWLFAKVLRSRNESELACKVLERAQKLPGKPETRIWLLRDYALLAEPGSNDAIQRWQALQQAFPAQADGFIGEAKALMKLEREAEARTKLAWALKADPANEEALRLSAEAAVTISDWSAAEAIWRSFRNHFDMKSAGYIGGAEASCHLGKFDEAKRLLESVANLFPRDATAMAERARLLAMLAQCSGATQLPLPDILPGGSSQHCRAPSSAPFPLPSLHREDHPVGYERRRVD